MNQERLKFYRLTIFCITDFILFSFLQVLFASVFVFVSIERQNIYTDMALANYMTPGREDFWIVKV